MKTEQIAIYAAIIAIALYLILRKPASNMRYRRGGVKSKSRKKISFSIIKHHENRTCTLQY